MKKILVIEDCAATRNLFLECLKAEGFYAIGAENGLKGVQLAQEHLPDVVICDIKMPELDGYGVLSRLRQNPSSAIIPFIVLTAKATEAESHQIMNLGADDYLTKLCTAEESLRAIAARLEKQTVLRQGFAAEADRVPEPLPTDTAKQAAPESSFPSVPHPQLRECFDFIEANYHQPIGVKEVAKAVGYSLSSLTKLVKKETGKTVHDWIVERRIVEARRLLLQTDQSIERIAAAAGYQNIVHFFRQFRQFHGTTPQTWRTTQRTQLDTSKRTENVSLSAKLVIVLVACTL